MSALGQKQTYAVRKGHVRFTSESGHVQCNYRCPLWANSGLVQRSNKASLFNHLVGKTDERKVEAKCLGGLKIDH